MSVQVGYNGVLRLLLDSFESTIRATIIERGLWYIVLDWHGWGMGFKGRNGVR